MRYFNYLRILGLAAVMFSNAVTVLAQSDLSPPTERINAVAASVSMREHSTSAELAVEPCQKGQDKRTSDLCAQWKAADAAAMSAEWTERTFWLGVFGTALGAATLVSAFLAALYARRAAVATERTIDVTRDIGQKQTRAYIGLGTLNVDLKTNAENGQVVGLDITPCIRNSGNSPAFCTRIYSSMIIVTRDETDPLPIFNLPHISEEDLLMCSSESNIMTSPIFLDLEILDKNQKGEIRIFIIIYTKYNDVFFPESTSHVFSNCLEFHTAIPLTYLKRQTGALPNGSYSVSNYSNHKISMQSS